MSDLIKRSDAIKAVMQKPAIHGSEGSWYHADDIKDALENVPSADRPQGEWIETADGTMCGNCHEFPYDDGEYHIANWSSDFCPHCGARMKGADNGEN